MFRYPSGFFKAMLHRLLQDGLPDKRVNFFANLRNRIPASKLPQQVIAGIVAKTGFENAGAGQPDPVAGLAEFVAECIDPADPPF